jgi:hypothetical protein
MPVSIRGIVEANLADWGGYVLETDAGSITLETLLSHYEGKHIQMTISIKELPQ